MGTLFLIPARGGSKGIPGKNLKPLAGKPLIYYTLDVAREVAGEEDFICVSTDNNSIIETVERYGIPVPFKRPAELASDQAGMGEVLLHALDHYNNGEIIDQIVLLQPTSPFRKAEHVTGALQSYTSELDMVVSVKITNANPYFVLAEENKDGYLEKSKKAAFVRRQDCPIVYQYNGAVYVINVKSLNKMPLKEFSKIRKYVMDEESSIDLDSPLDWEFAEFLLNSKIDKGY